MHAIAPKLTHRQSSDMGSGTRSGAGYGNKMSDTGSSGLDTSDTNFGSSGNTDSYSGSTEYGSGTTGGAG